MKARLISRINQHHLLVQEDRLLLGVSGGIDSMVMLHLFQQLDYPMAVAHCNFHLRGSESDGDEAFVRDYCAAHDIEFHSRQFDTKNYAEAHHLSIQLAARELRYQWFEELAAAIGCTRIATAHTLNDNLETILLNLTRGTGLDGMVGIPVNRDSIIRPLLAFSRREIETYAKENNLSWRNDSSNDQSDYQRNFLRHKVIPLLRELNPGLERTFSETQERFAGAQEVIKDAQRKLLNAYGSTRGVQWILSGEVFATLQYPVPFLWEAIKHYGFNYPQCISIIDSLSRQPGKQFVSSSHQLVVDRGQLIIQPLPSPLEALELAPEMVHAVLGSWQLQMNQTTDLEWSGDSSEVLVDRERLTFPLTWRAWTHGDFFYPLGMKHRKKISDYLIDEKLSIADKQQVTVLESNGEIIWVVGFRMDERYKITPATKVGLRLKAVPQLT